MADVHGQKNQMEKWSNYNQKEALSQADEKLKKEISSYNYYK